MVNSCSVLVLIGIILLFGGVGASVRFKMAGFIIPGGVGTLFIALGLLLSLLGKC